MRSKNSWGSFIDDVDRNCNRRSFGTTSSVKLPELRAELRADFADRTGSGYSCPDLWTDDPYHGREHYRNGNCHYFISFPVKQSGSCLSGVRTEYVSDKRKRHNTVTAL